MLVYMGAIANGGRAAVPCLLLQVDTPGLPDLPQFTRRTGRLIARDTAETLADMMAYNVTAAYGTSRFPNMDLCAKSGTAEVGGGQAPTPGSPASSGMRTTPTPFSCWWRTAGAAPPRPEMWPPGCSTLWCPPDFPRPAESLPCRADFLPPSRCICYADMVQLTYVTAAV